MRAFHTTMELLRTLASLATVGTLVAAGCVAPWGPEPSTPLHDWPFASGSLDGRRASDDPAITASSLPSLGVAWTYETHGAPTGTVTVVDNTAYVGTWQGRVVALEADNGRALWSHDVQAKVTGSVTVHDGLALFGDSKARVHALRADTGAPVWNRTVDPTLNAHLYATPLVVPAREGRGALVVQGIGSDQESFTLHGNNPVTFRGSVVALDLQTGSEVWRTWLGPEGSLGAPVWGTPVLVPAQDLVVFGTGNAYDAPASNMSDAIVALRVSDGSVAWSFQATKDDVFTHLKPFNPDWDFGSTPSVVTVAGRTLVIMGQKSSILWAIDALTGKVAWDEGTMRAGEGIIGDTAARDGRVFAPYVVLKIVQAFDASSGRVLWNRSLYGAGFSDPVAVPGAVIVADTTGALQGLEASTGRLLWNGSVGQGGVFGGLSIAAGHLFAPVVRDGYLGETGAVVAFAPGRAGGPMTSGAIAVPGQVLMKGYEFVPKTLSIRAGENATWVNEDPETHTVTFEEEHAEAYPEKTLAPGQSVSLSFPAPGEYPYYCRPHAYKSDDGTWTGMTGLLIVEGSPAT